MSVKHSTNALVLTALFAALTCAATMVIRIPTPATGGYIHPGDALVILSGLVLGPRYGFLAAGIGSGFSDLLGGYLLYVPATFLIKGLVAFLAATVSRRLPDTPKGRLAAIIISGLLDMALVGGGYFAFEYAIYGAAAIASVPANLLQGASGLAIALVLSPMLNALPQRKHRLS